MRWLRFFVPSALPISEPPTPIATDAVVIGAGPIGLFLVFQLGLQGLRAHLIDTLPHPGGQCVELYGDKPIYDIPALPVCSAHELVQRLAQQMAPFAPVQHLGEQVSTLQPLATGGWQVGTEQGTELHARAVFIAAGVGAFVPRTLKLPGLQAYSGGQVLYHLGDLAPWRANGWWYTVAAQRPWPRPLPVPRHPPHSARRAPHCSTGATCSTPHPSCWNNCTTCAQQATST